MMKLRGQRKWSFLPAGFFDLQLFCSIVVSVIEQIATSLTVGPDIKEFKATHFNMQTCQGDVTILYTMKIQGGCLSATFKINTVVAEYDIVPGPRFVKENGQEKEAINMECEV